MKKNRFYILLAALLLAAMPVFAGGNSAKNLAKQVLNLNKKAAELQEKVAGIEERALALSDRDRRAYQAELERLGFVPPAGLFNDGQALLTGAPPAPEGPGGILGLIVGIIGGGNRSRGNTTASPDETAAAPSTTAPAATTTAPASTPAPATTTTRTTTPASASGGLDRWTAPWNEIFMTGSTDDQIYAVAYGNGRFVAGGREGKMAYSADGRTWTAVENSPFDTNPAFAIAYGSAGNAGNRWVAGSFRGRMAYSADGVNWTDVAGTEDIFVSGYGQHINAIAYGNGRFVAVSNSGTMGYSDDGANWTASWTARDMSNINWSYSQNGVDFRADINGIAYGNNRWVIVGEGGNIAYSADGISWTKVADSPFPSTYGANSSVYPINAVAYGNNRFVAVGREGKMAYSTDGVRWTAVANSPFATNANIFAVAWGNNRFVAGGNYGRMAYSADGVSWTRVADSGFPAGYLLIAINAVAYGNGRFVAVGTQGRTSYVDW